MKITFEADTVEELNKMIVEINNKKDDFEPVFTGHNIKAGQIYTINEDRDFKIKILDIGLFSEKNGADYFQCIVYYEFCKEFGYKLYVKSFNDFLEEMYKYTLDDEITIKSSGLKVGDIFQHTNGAKIKIIHLGELKTDGYYQECVVYIRTDYDEISTDDVICIPVFDLILKLNEYSKM